MFITPEDGTRIVRELKATIGRDVNIMNREGIIIASTDPKRIGQTHEIARQITTEGLSIREVLEDDPAAGVQRGVNLPIHVDGVCEGVIGITGPAEEVRDFGTIAKKMAEILLSTMRQQEQQAHLERARNLFIEQWLFAPNPDWSVLALRGELLGIDVECARRVAILEYHDDPAERTARSAAELHSSRLLRLVEPAIQKDMLWAVTGNGLLLLFSGRSMERAGSILRELRRTGKERYDLQISGGLSSHSHGAEDIRRCYREAALAARSAAQDRVIREYGSGSLDFVLQNIDPTVRRDMLAAVFPPVDTGEQAEWLESLRLYIRYDGNVDRAAAVACVHPNTLRYRLRRLREWTGLDPRKPRDLVMLYIALHFSLEPKDI